MLRLSTQFESWLPFVIVEQKRNTGQPFRSRPENGLFAQGFKTNSEGGTSGL